MDPDATLDRIRRMAAAIRGDEGKYATLNASRGEYLAELVEALDQWVINGGFLPSDWAKAR